MNNGITSQKIILSMMILMTICGLLYAEVVELSGTVIDSDGNPLEGVTVTLARMDSLSDQTGSDGAFTLINGTRVLFPEDLKTSYGFIFRNNAIVFSAASENISGKLSLYSISGKLITSITRDDFSTAQLRLVLPKLSSGAYLLTGTINGESFTRSLVCMGNDRMRTKTTEAEGNSITLRKKTAAAIIDTLIASKEGYDTTRLLLDGYSKEKIKIVLNVSGAKPVVYMTKKITPEGLMAVYNAIGRQLPGKVMVKVHTGEPDGQYFIKPAMMKDVVELVNGTIVETCVLYGGQRASAATSLQVAKDNGFTDIADVDILDKDGQISLPVNGGKHLQENFVGKNIENYNSCLAISHFKGHSMAGLGGAIKNISIGFASKEGKALIHTVGASNAPTISSLIARYEPGNADQEFLESMVEAAKSVVDKLGGNLVFINVAKDLTLDCDCEVGTQHAPSDADIGILGSIDPVAVDQACADLVDRTGDLWKERIAVYDGTHQMEYGEEIGLGSRDYELKDID